jgi:hypothetical protein
MSKVSVTQVLVANVGTANTGTTLPTIANSDILIFKEGTQTALTGTPGTTGIDKIYIAQGLGNTGAAQIGTPLGIKVKNITKMTAAAYVAPTPQVIAIGYAGTGTANITAPTNDTSYELTIVFKDDQRFSADARQMRRTYYAQTDASATTQELINNFVTQINNDLYMRDKIIATSLTNGTFTALTNNATVTALSPTVTSTAHGLVAGDLVRIGGTGSTAAVYQVKSAPDANTIILTSPYQGTSTTILAANIGKMTAVTLTGIRLEAKPVPYNGIDFYQVINFDAFMNNEFTGVPESKTTITAFTYGAGTYQIVRDMEYIAQGYVEGPKNRTQFPDANVNGLGGSHPTRATAAGQYSLVVIEYGHRHIGDFLGVNEAPLAVVVAFNIASATTKRDSFMATMASITGLPFEQNF